MPDATQGPVTVTDGCQDDDSSAAPSLEPPMTDDCKDDDSSAATLLEPPMTEHDQFMAAEEAGRVASEKQVSG